MFQVNNVLSKDISNLGLAVETLNLTEWYKKISILNIINASEMVCLLYKQEKYIFANQNLVLLTEDRYKQGLQTLQLLT